MNKKRKEPRTKKGFFILLIAALVGWAIWQSFSKDPAPAPKKKITRAERVKSLFSAWDGSQDSVTVYIKNHIKDPDSYKHIRTEYYDKGDFISVVTEYSATNGFGGRVRSTCYASIDSSGKLLSAQIKE